MTDTHTGWTRWLSVAAVLVSLGLLGYAFGHAWTRGEEFPEETGGTRPRPDEKHRSAKGQAAVLVALVEDMRKTPAAARSQRRYLLLHHLHNNPQIGSDQVNAARRALRELSFFFTAPGQPQAIRAIDPDRLIFALDLEALGWDADDAWQTILNVYPYRLTHNETGSPEVRKAYKELVKLSGSTIPYVRGDWLAASLNDPPLGGFEGALELGNWPLPPSVQGIGESYDKQPMCLAAVAADLGLEKAGELEELIRDSPRFRDTFGLAPLLRNGTIRRDAWEHVTGGITPFQALSEHLRHGEPVHRKEEMEKEEE